MKVLDFIKSDGPSGIRTLTHEKGRFVVIDSDTGSAQVQYLDHAVENDRRYVYRIIAVNDHGENRRSRSHACLLVGHVCSLTVTPLKLCRRTTGTLFISSDYYRPFRHMFC